jgi:hypothetical protein
LFRASSSATRDGERDVGVVEMELQQINQITEKIIGCANEVHRHLRPGLLEATDARAPPGQLPRSVAAEEKQLQGMVAKSDIVLAYRQVAVNQ